MKLDDIDRGTVTRTIAKMPGTFHTKDLSRHDDMINSHAAVRSEPTYHQMVGVTLSRLSAEPGGPVIMVAKRHSKLGQLWRRR